MITPAYIRTMAFYNAEMNRRFYAAAATLTERFPELEARVYGAPLLRSSASVRVKSFRHRYDPISMLDRGAVTNAAPGRNPHTLAGY